MNELNDESVSKRPKKTVRKKKRKRLPVVVRASESGPVSNAPGNVQELLRPLKARLTELENGQRVPRPVEIPESHPLARAVHSAREECARLHQAAMHGLEHAQNESRGFRESVHTQLDAIRLSTGDTSTRVSQLNLGPLEERLGRLENRAPAPVVDLGPLEERLGRLENRAPVIDLGPLEERLDRLENRAPAPVIDLGPLETRIEELEARSVVSLEPLEERIERVESRLSQQPSQASMQSEWSKTQKEYLERQLAEKDRQIAAMSTKVLEQHKQISHLKLDMRQRSADIEQLKNRHQEEIDRINMRVKQQARARKRQIVQLLESSEAAGRNGIRISDNHDRMEELERLMQE